MWGIGNMEEEKFLRVSERYKKEKRRAKDNSGGRCIAERLKYVNAIKDFFTYILNPLSQFFLKKFLIFFYV